MFSQEQKSDSLRDYSFNELYNKFNTSLFKNPSLARVYAEQGLLISKENNNTATTIGAYNMFAKLESELGNTDKAFEYIDKAISLAKQDSKLIASGIYSKFTKANILFSTGQYKKAFKNYTVAYDYYKKEEQEYLMNVISSNIALIKNNLGDHESCIEILSKCLHHYENTPKIERSDNFSRDFRPSCLLGISSAYVKYAIKSPSKKDSLLNIAADYNSIGFKEAIEEKNKSYEISFIINAGIIEEERGNYDKALIELNTASSKIQDYKEPSSLTALYYYKGRSHKKLNELDAAIKYFKKADSISTKNSSNYRMLQGAYYSLIGIYKELNDTDNVSKYQNLYIENQRINAQISQEVRDDIHNIYDLDILDGEISYIKKSNKKAMIVIGLLVIVLVVFFLFYRKQKQKNKVAFDKLVKQLEEKQSFKITNEKTKNAITIDDEKVIQVLKALEKFEEKEWYRNKNCDLAFVAKKAKTNKTYLSKIIHEHKQLKFIDYIRNLRIDYALERLKDDPVFRSYDIKSIAEESGFKSSDMFSRAFVKNTGIYPSYYIKNINKINS
ncbi:helix-turn-helix domain-containing protein [uncultured Kordia sp.]|uniref:helix-turn-helix domain-containing protein n=1 Tax=uncultured Kordia sp. TaxID=507699 RepID=UPI002603B142|nr:helix-turn-helix domain-containing protein [uncultured Kordia sp.]